MNYLYWAFPLSQHSLAMLKLFSRIYLLTTLQLVRNKTSPPPKIEPEGRKSNSNPVGTGGVVRRRNALNV